jgi:hypothetical protein
MENNQQQIHINAMIQSLTSQVTNLSAQLADAQGVIAVLQDELKGNEEAPEGELADKVVN